MLETFHARVDAGMEATVNGEEACPCSIFGEVSQNDDLMSFLYTVWNGALMALVQYLPDASEGRISPANPFALDNSPGDAAGVVERLANDPSGAGPGPFGEALRHVIILAAAAGHAAALDEINGVPQSTPSEDDFEAFLQSLMEEASRLEADDDDGPDSAA